MPSQRDKQGGIRSCQNRKRNPNHNHVKYDAIVLVDRLPVGETYTMRVTVPVNLESTKICIIKFSHFFLRKLLSQHLNMICYFGKRLKNRGRITINGWQYKDLSRELVRIRPAPVYVTIPRRPKIL